jgi:large subunit ribosomal protein L13
MKSYLPKDPGDDRLWVVIDADGKPLGRLAVRIANMLRGKHRPTFSRQVDTGDFVVVINAEKVKLTGKKEGQKLYHRYSGYRGGLKSETAAAVRERHPERLIEGAVKGMLPKNNLSRKMYRRLKVYTGSEHPHEAQNPQLVESL